MLRVGIGVLVVLSLGAAPAGAPTHFEQMRVIAPAAPGGGWDQTARAMQQALQQAGHRAHGRRSRTFPELRARSASPGSSAPSAARATSSWSPASSCWALSSPTARRSRCRTSHRSRVSPASTRSSSSRPTRRSRRWPISSRRSRKRPESISWGGGSAGGSDQILAGLIADAVGVAPRRINYIAFSGGGESLSAIVGGQVVCRHQRSRRVRGADRRRAPCARSRSRAPSASPGSMSPPCASRAWTSSSRTGARSSPRRA